VDEGDCKLKTVIIHDTTLREGDQTPNIVMRKETKLKIATILEEMGVDEIEVGFPKANPMDREVLRELSRQEWRAKLIGFARAVKDDIDAVIDAGCQSILLFAPGSRFHIKAYMSGKTIEDIASTISSAIDYAKSRGAFVEIALTDAPRAIPEELLYLIRKAVESKADRIILADTVGVAHPITIEKLVSLVKNHIPCSVGLHLHNDLGLALANAYVGISEGADEIQVTVGGIGERCGNTALEELAAVQLVSKLWTSNLKLNLVGPKVQEILEELSIKPCLNKPLIGENAFTHTTDIHIYSTLSEPDSFEPFDPGALGLKRRFLITHLTGKRAIMMLLKHKSLDVTPERVEKIYNLIREKILNERRPLSVDELIEICNAVT
jgi:isopropylmalate/homocitrate/citramalate synthase